MSLAQDIRNLNAEIARTPARGPNAPADEVERFLGNAQVIVHGARAAHEGVLVGWHGGGTLTRAKLAAALAEQEVEAEWLPASKSADAHLGAAMYAQRSGRVVRCLGAGRWKKNKETGDKARAYRVRWAVVSLDREQAQVGGQAGEYSLLADLTDESDDLVIAHDGSEAMATLGQAIRAEYERRRGEEIYSAADVTRWLRQTLTRRCGAARYSVGWYVPQEHAETAERLLLALDACAWGTDLTVPALPVVGSEALAKGIARNFAGEVDAVSRGLERERAAARDRGEIEVSVKVAGRLLRDLREVHDRALAYRALCGDDALAETRARMAVLLNELGEINGAAAQRFALLELDVAPVQDEGRVPDLGSAQRRADEALARRREEMATTGETRHVEASENEPDTGTVARFSLLELDAPAEPAPWYEREGGMPPGVESWIAEMSQAAVETA